MILAIFRKSQISVSALRWDVTRISVTPIFFSGGRAINCLHHAHRPELRQSLVEQIIAVRLIRVRYQISPPLMANLMSVIRQVERLIQSFSVRQHESVEASAGKAVSQSRTSRYLGDSKGLIRIRPKFFGEHS